MSATTKRSLTLMNLLAENIRKLRRDAGLTQEELARLVGVTRVTIARIELGNRMPDWGFVCRLADVFGVSTDDLRNDLRVTSASRASRREKKTIATA